MKKQQNNDYYKTKKKYTQTFKYFFKVMLIAFVPIFIIDILIGVLLKGQHEWIIWVVTLVGLIIAGCIGLYLEGKMQKAQREEELRKKRQGKAIPRKEDIDVFGD